MTPLVGYLLLFVGVSVFFVFFHLVLGRIVRPTKSEPDKLTIYECGEPTIGSSWIQFDLRFYVVALLFVIFDVEVAFFFPWAVVFGQANTIAKEADQNAPQMVLAKQELMREEFKKDPNFQVTSEQREAAGSLAWMAFVDILVFFGVLLVGFAYLWKRGDINWVRSTAAERLAPTNGEPAVEPPSVGVLVGVGRE